MRRLVLFFDLYCSFTKYDGEGLLLRDLLLYEKLIEQGDFDEVMIFTYDDRDRAKLAELQQDGRISQAISVLTPPPALRSGLAAVLYSIIGPIRHRSELAEATVFKTHQVSGAWTALMAKWLFRKPLLFRLGYPLSVRFQMEGKLWKARATRALERLMVRCSDGVAVTSRTMQMYYGAMSKSANVSLIPSYVDLSGFTAIDRYDGRLPILFIGRLDPVKNVAALIEACSRLGVELDIYGGGSLEDELKALAASLGAKARFHGFVANSDLMRIHHNHSICVLCSTREGMPKSLIEAMGSGLVCLSTRTDGALELLEDGKTGYLIDGFDAGSIAECLRSIISNLDPEVGRRARRFVHANNSLEHSIDLERAALRRICPARVVVAARREGTTPERQG
jgi:glycosyltransferase involved in cell wall biosynthesis